MPRFFRLFCLFTCLCTVIACTPPAPKELPEAELRQVFEKIDADVTANCKAYQRLETATVDIGHRLTGSENGKKADKK